MEYKVCSQCKEKLPIRLFRIKADKPCRMCVVCEYKYNRDIYIKNMKTIKQYRKAHRLKDGVRERERERRKIWEENNQDKVLAYNEKSKERKRRRQDEWRKNNKELVKQQKELYIQKLKSDPQRYELYKSKQAEYARKARAEFKNFTIRALLRMEGFKNEDITNDMIILKRAQLKLDKLIKSYENETN